MDARALLELGSAGVAARILRTWAASGASAGRATAVMHALAASARGETGAWPRAARLVAADADGRLELDAVPGLRTRIWKDGVGGTMPAIVQVLAERARARAGDGELIQLREDRLWIPDTALPELAYHLELDARGIGPGWDREAACADLAGGAAAQLGGADGNLARLWRRWTRWAGAGARPCVRAWLAHPAVVGSIPATGLDARAGALAGLMHAVRATPPAAPAVPRTAPLLLPWCRERIPIVRQLMLLAEAPAHRHLRAGATRSGLRAGLACDPVVALPAGLAAHVGAGERSPLSAVVATLRASLRVALAGAVPAARCAAPWRIEITHRPALPPVSLCSQGGRLLLDGQGIATLAAWLGWFPLHYSRYASDTREGRARSGCWTWPWPAMEACGWSALEAAGAWTRVRGPSTSEGPWFTCGGANASLPRARGWPTVVAATRLGGANAITGGTAVPNLLRWSA